jgi:hypothetical protein
MPTPFVAPAIPTYPRFVPTRKRSITRDVLSMYRGLDKYQKLTGEYVRWYQYDAANSTSNPVYDEGPSRRWLPSIQVPVLFVLFQQPPNNPTEAGRYTVADVHFTVSYDQLVKAGISQPSVSDLHFSDRIEWDGKLFDLEDYRLQGYVHGTYMTVGVDGHQVKEEELEQDYPMPS